MIDRKLVKQITGVDPEQAKARWNTLTPWEGEVAEKLARGFTNAEVAADLKISPKTLAIHRSNVQFKQAVKTLADPAMVYYAMQLTETT